MEGVWVLVGVVVDRVGQYVYERLIGRRREARSRAEADHQEHRWILAPLAPALRDLIDELERAVYETLGGGGHDLASRPVGERALALAVTWDEPACGPLVTDTRVRDAYWRLHPRRWAEHWRWLRSESRPMMLAEELFAPHPDVAESDLNPREQAMYGSARTMLDEASELREEVERFVPLY